MSKNVNNLTKIRFLRLFVAKLHWVPFSKLKKKDQKNVVEIGNRKFLHLLKSYFCWCHSHEDRNNECNISEEHKTSNHINNEQHMRRKDIKPIRG